jgi:hypothetical protein
MKRYGIFCNGEVVFSYWNAESLTWEKQSSPGYFINGEELLLLPKNIVRKHYLLSTEQYFKRIIIERIRENGGYLTPDGKNISKKDIIKSRIREEKHWLFNDSVRYTKRHSESLVEYHAKYPYFYKENGLFMSDDELDSCIYGFNISHTA